MFKQLETIGKTIHNNFQNKDKKREESVVLTRNIIRNASLTIKLLHRNDFKKALETLKKNEKLKKEIDNKLKNIPELFYSGMVQDALKEYVESKIFYEILIEKNISPAESLNVFYPTYLKGLSEVVGELRRFILDSLRDNKNNDLIFYLNIMEEIYIFLFGFDYPDALTYGLRRYTDNTRQILERTRGDLTMHLRQLSLEKKLQQIKDLS